MVRKEDGPKRGIVEITPLEAMVDKDGNASVIFGVASNRPEGGKVAKQFLEEEFGGSVKDITAKVKGGKDFFFSSNWNSPWNPQGPKKNWVSPEHPERN